MVENPIEASFELPGFQRPAASPDGDLLAYFWGRGDCHDICVTELSNSRGVDFPGKGANTDGHNQLTEGGIEGDFIFPLVWAPDGERIFFHSAEHAHGSDIRSIDLEGEISSVVAREGKCVLRDVSRCGRYLLFDRTIFSEDGPEISLFCFDRRTDEYTEFSAYRQPGACFGPESERIASRDHEGVYVSSTDDSEKRYLDVDHGGAVPRGWHPYEDVILLSGTVSGVYDLSRETLDWLGEPGEFGESAKTFTPDGRRVIATRRYDVSERPVVYTLETGTERELNFTDGVAKIPAWTGADACLDNGCVLVTRTTPTERPELLSYDLATNEWCVLIEAEYDGIDRSVFVEPEYITYESDDGVTIGALLYDSGRRPSPAIVDVHGGPRTHVTKSLRKRDLRAQLFAQRGYTVLRPNFRGSTGRGDQFYSLLSGEWGFGDAEDVKAAGEWLMADDRIDRERVAVFGFSYGGFAVFVQLTRFPEFWNAGVAWNGWTDPDEGWYSPIDNVDALERPFLALVGEHEPQIEDYRRFRDALVDRGWEPGVEFDYRELSDFEHFSSDPERNRRILSTVVDFLDRRI